MKLWQRLADVLWPRGLKCLCCEEFSEGELLCPSCLKGLEAMHLPPELRAKESVHSVYQYDGAAKQLVLLLKMECVADAALVLAEGLAEELRRMQLPPDTVLTWVTMPQRRKRERGIDHGMLLCKAVAERTGLPVSQLLVRKGNVHTQRGLNYQERMKNLTDSIVCQEVVTSPVLLIDDVLTTGATVSVCAQALMKAGAPRVYALTATRVPVRIHQC